MLLEKERRKVDLIEALAERVRDLAGESAEEAARFVCCFYAQVPPADLLEEREEDLCGAALSIWSFARSRTAGQPKVRLYNPNREDNGWGSPHTIVEIVNDDMPFLVDSVASALARLGAPVRLVIHPVLRVRRDSAGLLLELRRGEADPGKWSSESWMQLEIEEQGTKRHAEIREELERVLADVRVSVGDWRAMRQRCAEIFVELESAPPPLPEDEVAETLAFLRWLNDNHFTYLGYREYRFEGTGSKAVAHVLPDGLGLLRDAEYTVFDGLRHLGRLPRDVRHFVRQPDLLRITKANRRATVHRDVYMDTVTLKAFDREGNVTGERLFLGLFTASAYAESVLDIPILRQKAVHVLERSGVDTLSHDGRSMLHILATYPRDELFQITAGELLEVATDILHLQERRRIALFVRRDPFERFVSCLVYVPRERFDTSLREKLQAMVASAYEGSVSAFYTHMTDAPLARVHFIVKTTPGEVPEVDTEELEQRLIEAGRSWESRLEALLVERVGESEGIRSARRYARAFPPTYRDSFDESAAVADIESIEQAIETRDLAMRLYRPVGMPADEMQLKMFTAGSPLPLSDVMPMLENMGLQVLDEVPYDVDTEEMGARVYLRNFQLRSQVQQEVDLAAVREPFYEALARVWRREMADDGFNRLVLGAGLGSREVTVLRAYSRYIHQLRAPFSQASIEATLARNPTVASRLVALFVNRFDPHRKDRKETEKRIIGEIETLLEKVVSLDEDRIMRRLRNLILSTLRTNYFQTASDGEPKPYLSLKLDSARIERMPSPRPYREIWVYGACFEGVHLRGGEVARGGIRWSDRREDFRTEILGLMKAQMTKNAVIVPVGAKGGFVLACHVSDRRELLQEAVDCYRHFIRGLLDLTDNRQGHLVVPPPDLVRHDGDDSYLVVAADKGTATFSDIANEVAEEYDYWLGDAFASGGSAGYDHKKMAITARGAWESVKRHFREMGVDVQRQDFTVVGVGDMAGDVFGNGMLQSPHIRLIGAFNHEHIFVDPDPQPAVSFAERRRLFETPGSSWADYDRAALSAGGGVFDRQAKAVELSAEIRRRLEIEEQEVTPAELIRSLLAAPADLLWFGGIGTFVKSRDESHFVVGDSPNDGIRVDAQQLRAKVVAEGANLGMTQLARIEYARGGGRVNTDAVDNSAGVACSDREVNIKILLSEVERDGDMTRKQRNELLAQMTEEVAELVLHINYLQTQTISATHQLGPHLVDRLARVMRGFEKQKVLDRRIEFLPGDEEIEERLARHEGFTRPELAVLLAYAKNDLYAQLVRSDLGGDRELDQDILEYFPSLLRERFAARIVRHRLRRQLVATIVGNEMLNRGGLGFVREVEEQTGASSSQIARAFVAARDVLEMRSLWEEIDALDYLVPWQRQASMMLDCGRLLEAGTVWLLREEDGSLDIGTVVDTYGNGVRELREGLEELVTPEAADGLFRRVEALREEGVPEALARHIAALPLLGPVWDVVRIARSTELPLPPVARLFFEVGDRFGFDWLRRAATQLSADDAWEKLAVSALVDDSLGHQGALVSTIVRGADDPGDDLQGALREWEARNERAVARTDQLLSELQSLGSPALSMLAVANRQLKSLSRLRRADGVTEGRAVHSDGVGVEP